MAARKRPCICSDGSCRETGDEATIRLPSDLTSRSAWLALLGIDVADCDDNVLRGRVSLAHFTASQLSAQAVPDGPCLSGPNVRVRRGAEPSQTSEDIRAGLVGASGRAMRWEAAARHLDREKLEMELKLSDHQAEVCLLKERLAQAHRELEDTKTKGGGGGDETRRGQGITYHILDDINQRHAQSLCGLPGPKSLERLYRAVNYSGAADAMVFYGGDSHEREAGEEAMDAPRSVAKKRKKVFRGVNGLFFTLFVLRTAIPIVVASSLFGVNETTGGRAFSSWVRFLAGSLRPFVRLPSMEEVHAHAPKNFIRKRLTKCVLIIDATELELMRVWLPDIAHVLWSPYKQRPTAKVMIGVTHGGAICHISDAYGGRLTDTDIVRESGLIGELERAGFAHGGNGGYSVMADRGFTPLGQDLTRVGIKLVAPPCKRTRGGEGQFSRQDAEQTRTTANLRIHVERAIGALKEWGILHTKVAPKQMDMIPLYFQVCGALVNITRKDFSSDR